MTKIDLNFEDWFFRKRGKIFSQKFISFQKSPGSRQTGLHHIFDRPLCLWQSRSQSKSLSLFLSLSCFLSCSLPLCLSIVFSLFFLFYLSVSFPYLHHSIILFLFSNYPLLCFSTQIQERSDSIGRYGKW